MDAPRSYFPKLISLGLGSRWIDRMLYWHWRMLCGVIDGCTEWSVGLVLSHFGWFLSHGRSVQFDGHSGSLEINFKNWRAVRGFSWMSDELINTEDQMCGCEFWLSANVDRHSIKSDGHSVRCRQNLCSSLFIWLKFDSNLDWGWSWSCMCKRSLVLFRWHVGPVIARFWALLINCN
jgi:hypothetical protein